MEWRRSASWFSSDDDDNDDDDALVNTIHERIKGGCLRVKHYTIRSFVRTLHVFWKEFVGHVNVDY